MSIDKIKEIATKTADVIKNIILSEAEKVAQNFPKIIFGIRDKKPRKQTIVNGILSSVNVTVKATEKEIPAIVLYKDDRFWTESFVVVLTLSGIFKCPYVMTEPANAKEQKQKGYLVSVTTRPDWEDKLDAPYLWIKYGEVALRTLAKLK